MSYTPQQIANYFIDRAKAEGRELGQLKLMKLVYIAYGWVLALTGRRLFDEPIRAWKHGPVMRTLYDEFKRFRSGPITAHATEYDLDTGEQIVPTVPREDEETTMILDKVWAAYKAFSGWSLRNKTHEPDTPWTTTYYELGENSVISDTLIASHFRTVIRRLLDDVRTFAA
jgi:uncharacterized phage-associated protein